LGIAYNGHSALLDFNANSLLFFQENATSIQTVEIQLELVQRYREKFAVWKDADSFDIN